MMQEVELYVFDVNLNLLGIIDDYQKIEFEHKYYAHSVCFLTVPGSPKISELLLVNDEELEGELRILVRSDDLQRGYIVETAEFTDEAKTNVDIIAYSLSYMLSWRIILGQQRYYGTTDYVLKAFVDKNAITTNSSRVIPNLVLGLNSGLSDSVDESFTNKELDIALWDVCKKNECSYEILIDHANKKYVFTLFKGINRSALQDANPRIIFAQEFENVEKQSYVDDKSNYRSTAFVGGEGEGNSRRIIEVGPSVGFNRREVFFDARDLQSEYSEDGETVVIPDTEYVALLIERGNNRKQDYQRIRTFESNINPHAQFTFNVDYYLGDIVSNRNDNLNIIMHNRVVVAKETIDRSGSNLEIELGEPILNLIDKVKRETKSIPNSGGVGSRIPGEAGQDGVGINYVVDGTTIGIKREDEPTYTFIETKGEQGEIGPAGSDANVTSENIASALGYIPVKASDVTWENVLAKPITFTPSAHSHSWTEILNKPSTFKPASHNHAWNEITDKPTTFEPSIHSHAWDEITGKPSVFTPSSHTHTKSEVGLGSLDNAKQVNAISTGSTADPNTTQVPYILTNHANSPSGGIYWHIYTMFYSSLTSNRAQIAVTYNGLNARLMVRHIYGTNWTAWEEFSNTNHSHAWGDITGKPSEFAPSAHGHTWSEISSKPTTFAPSAHNHTIANITGLETELNAKETPTGAQTKATAAQAAATNHANALIGTRIIDNRSVIPKPSDYATNRTTNEFKFATTVGLGGIAGTYVHVFSERAWGDPSGGYVHQLAYDGLTTRIWTRYGNQTTDVWGEWSELESTTGAQAKVNAHANLKTNPHAVTKAQVGLGSVLNYGIATQAEAEEGTSNAKYMTPLRVQQVITKNLAGVGDNTMVIDGATVNWSLKVNAKGKVVFVY